MDIEEKRNSPIMKWANDGSENREPDRHGQIRFNEILAAYDQYCADREAAKEASGLTAALKLSEKLGDEREALRDEIAAIRATSLEGIRLKARIVFDFCWNGDQDDVDGNFALDERLMRRLVFELVGRPFPEPSESDQEKLETA